MHASHVAFEGSPPEFAGGDCSRCDQKGGAKPIASTMRQTVMFERDVVLVSLDKAGKREEHRHKAPRPPPPVQDRKKQQQRCSHGKNSATGNMPAVVREQQADGDEAKKYYRRQAKRGWPTS
jgi:hypothetical protein